uniref:Uncharacterized protein n=1 Tax=Romanomermis culicivorax TaxID=13658 RepID=A0A915IYG8_ROMCU
MESITFLLPTKENNKQMITGKVFPQEKKDNSSIYSCLREYNNDYKLTECPTSNWHTPTMVDDSFKFYVIRSTGLIIQPANGACMILNKTDYRQSWGHHNRSERIEADREWCDKSSGTNSNILVKCVGHPVDGKLHQEIDMQIDKLDDQRRRHLHRSAAPKKDQKIRPTDRSEGPKAQVPAC